MPHFHILCGDCPLNLAIMGINAHDFLRGVDAMGAVCCKGASQHHGITLGFTYNPPRAVWVVLPTAALSCTVCCTAAIWLVLHSLLLAVILCGAGALLHVCFCDVLLSLSGCVRCFVGFIVEVPVCWFTLPELPCSIPLAPPPPQPPIAGFCCLRPQSRGKAVVWVEKQFLVPHGHQWVVGASVALWGPDPPPPASYSDLCPQVMFAHHMLQAELGPMWTTTTSS